MSCLQPCHGAIVEDQEVLIAITSDLAGEQQSSGMVVRWRGGGGNMWGCGGRGVWWLDGGGGGVVVRWGRRGCGGKMGEEGCGGKMVMF